MRQVVTLRISEGESIDMLLLRSTSVNQWEKIEIGLGRRKETFSMSINSKGYRNARVYLVLDDIEFIDCALPLTKKSSCEEFQCKKNHACVEFDKVCDMTDDCGDGTDEDNCQTYHFSDFENDFGFFQQVKNEPNVPLQWNITSGAVPGRLLYQVGPSIDHTFSTPSGHYAYFTGRRARNERAWLVSEVFSAEEERPCRMTFYYFMYGIKVNQLNIYTRTNSNGKRSDSRWTKTGQEGNYWQRGQIVFTGTDPFEVILEGKAGEDSNDVIAIDDVSFSSDCRYIDGRALSPETTIPPTITTEIVTNCKFNEFSCVSDKVCIPLERKCNFRKDCADGSDENGCVKSSCDFQYGDLCNWRIFHKLNKETRTKREANDDDAIFRWVAIQANDDKDELWNYNKMFRPKTDHSSNSTEGWYLMADAVIGAMNDVTSLTSPLISTTGSRCALDFWYYCYNCNITVYIEKEGVNGSKSSLVWNYRDYAYSSYSSGTWKHAKASMNHLSSFKVRFDARKQYSSHSIGALDDVSFEKCAPPVPPEEGNVTCKASEFMCGDSVCIPDNLLCDYHGDCNDFSDEREFRCLKYVSRCSFENGVCPTWHIEIVNNYKWTVRTASLLTYYSSVPRFDHTTGEPEGRFISLSNSFGTRNNKPKFHSDTINGQAKDCKVRFWYNNMGPDHKINIYQRTSYTENGSTLLGSAQTDVPHYWHRGEIPANGEGNDFQIVFEGEMQGFQTGSINVDDISLTPGCKIVDRELPGKPTSEPPVVNDCAPEKFMCKNGECYTHLQRCNFIDDCDDQTDELNCGGSCNFDYDTCGWFTPTAYSNQWSRKNGKMLWTGGPTGDHTLTTSEGFYMMPTVYAPEFTQLHSKVFVASGPRCKMSLWYYLDGKSVGSLSLLIRYSEKLEHTKELWKLSGPQGPDWKFIEANIGTQQFFSMIVESSKGVSINQYVAIDDVKYTDCEPTHPPVECVSDEWMCKDVSKCIKIWEHCDGKYDCADKSDEMNCDKQYGDCSFDDENWLKTCGWKLSEYYGNWSAASKSHSDLTGPKTNHNERIYGYYIFLNSSDLEEGERVAVETPIFKASEEKCHLRFWYYMKGSDSMGMLEVMTKGVGGQETALWETDGNKGDQWIYGHVLLGSSQDYRVVFLAERGGDNLTDIAIDDVSFTNGCKDGGIAVIPTGQPPICRDYQFRCLSDGSCIPGHWRCDCEIDCEDGSDEDGCETHCIFTGSPKTIPTETFPTTIETTPITIFPSTIETTSTKTFPTTIETTSTGTTQTTTDTLLPQKDCNDTWKLCKDGKTCIPGLLLCDGVKDCPDNSDEQDCTYSFRCEPTFYFCKDRAFPPCIHRDNICNGKWDCSDGSDESLCNVCPGTFCKNNGNCTIVKEVPVCECPEDYAQNRCGKRTVSPNETTDTTPTEDIPTTTEITVLPRKYCNNTWKLCNDGKTCIPGLLLCDGVKDCPDNSDEEGCIKSFRCEPTFYFCNDRAFPPCIHRDKVCNGKWDCSDGSDESLCNVCSGTFCKNKGNCTIVKEVPVCKCPESYAQNRCEKKIVCPDDEGKVSTQTSATEPTTKTTPTEPISTTSGTVLPQMHCNDTWKLCKDGKTCIPGLLLCDGVKDCPDNSDEQDCTKSFRCEPTFYFCNDLTFPPCIHRDKVCNGKWDCSDGSDESLCNICLGTFCKNKGNCTIVKEVPVCECPKDYAQNRCGKRIVSPHVQEKILVQRSGAGWIAAVVIITILLVFVVVLIWFKRTTNVERQKLQHAVENPAYGLNLDNLTFGESNAHVPETDAAQASHLQL